MSKVISVNDIVEGMICVEPIVNRYGQTLLSAGVTLNAQHANILKTWNIKVLRISGGDEDISFDISDELKELITIKIKKRMNWSPRVPIEEDLMQMTIANLAKNMTRTKEQES